MYAPALIRTQTSGLHSLPRTLPQGPKGFCLLCRTPLLPSLLSLPSSCMECPLIFSSSSHPLLFLSGCGGPILFSGFSSGFSESSWVSSLSAFLFLSCLVSFAHVPSSLGLYVNPHPAISLGLCLCSRVSPCGHPFSLYLPLLLGEKETGSKWVALGPPPLPCCQAWHGVGPGVRDYTWNVQPLGGAQGSKVGGGDVVEHWGS